MRLGLERVVFVAICSLAVASCGSGRHRPYDDDEPKPEPFHRPVEILLAYDANHDGTITRAEMEAGLKADFAAADTNHDGRLDENEVRAVNQKRWADGLSTASPLIDWNHDGYVDFNEFAGTARSLFDEVDTDGDGVLTPKELRRAGAPAKDKPAAHTHGKGHRPPDGDDDDKSGPPAP